MVYYKYKEITQMKFIELTNAFGDKVTTNLDHVKFIYSYDSKGIHAQVVMNDGQEIFVKETYQEIKKSIGLES